MLVRNINSPSKNGLYKTSLQSNTKAINFGRFGFESAAIQSGTTPFKRIRVKDAIFNMIKEHTYTKAVRRKVTSLQNHYFAIRTKISRTMDAVLTRGKGKHIEKIIEAGKTAPDKNYSILKESDAKGGRTRILETFPDESSCERKFNPKTKEMTEMTRSFPKNGPRSFVLSPESGPVHSVTEYYHYNNLSNETKTEKRFTQNYDGSSLEEHFDYIAGEQIIAKSIKTDAKGNITITPVLPIKTSEITVNEKINTNTVNPDKNTNTDKITMPAEKNFVGNMIETGSGQKPAVTEEISTNTINPGENTNTNEKKPSIADMIDTDFGEKSFLNN